ncbi:uncharacterized mitochondrial protein AtMg00310-like [Primulina eburnea]|uniref:uncharacterized mitochondrial protein AtMg00310-like n=1 Tax=Primulina eburnea TaxID=1245227 RepID=UPI003C6C4A15
MNVFLLPRSTTEELQRIMNSFWWGSNPNGNRGIKWLSWDRLCAPKQTGGMWFRNLKSFNLAMLGKQAWNLIAKPDSLMTRVLKAKYFPNSNFLDASLGHNPSFIWRSLWSSRIIIKRGVRWRIGKGDKINVWREPWLRDPRNFYITTPPITELHSLKVCDLFIPFTTQWDHELLDDIFGNTDVHEILNIHVHTNIGGDQLIWHYSSNGKYQVRSGYKIAQELLSDDVVPTGHGEWQKL